MSVHQVVNQGDTVALSATAEDADGDSLTYLWSITSKPKNSNAKLTYRRTKTASFIADKKG